MSTLIVARTVLLLVMLAACAGNDEASDTPTTNGERPTTAAPKPGCLTVSRSFLSRLGVFPASAVNERVPAKDEGLTQKGEIWFVSTQRGESWVTNADPTSDNPEGLIFALNEKARAASPATADVPAGSLALEGLSDSSPGAVRSRTCAGAE